MKGRFQFVKCGNGLSGTDAGIQQGNDCKQVCRLAFEKLDGLREEMKRLERQMEALAEEGTLSEENARHMDEVLKRYMALQTKYETEGGYETQDRFARICTGLKLSERFLEAEFDRLSGGEKTLVCLAKHCSSSRIFSYWMNRPTIWICPCCNGWKNI